MQSTDSSHELNKRITSYDFLFENQQCKVFTRIIEWLIIRLILIYIISINLLMP